MVVNQNCQAQSSLIELFELVEILAEGQSAASEGFAFEVEMMDKYEKKDFGIDSEIVFKYQTYGAKTPYPVNCLTWAIRAGDRYFTGVEPATATPEGVVDMVLDKFQIKKDFSSIHFGVLR